MSYRSAADSLRAYRDRLECELQAAREAAKKVKPLEKELAETTRLLEKTTGKRELPLLESMAIAAPCTASWAEMVGGERIRFCAHCAKNVYNLSAMRRDEAEALLRERGESICVRLYKRADGTVLTTDCPVGVKRRRRRRALAAAAVGGGMLAAGSAAMATVAVQGEPVRTQYDVVMGATTGATPDPPATDLGGKAEPPATADSSNATPSMPARGHVVLQGLAPHTHASRAVRCTPGDPLCAPTLRRPP